MMTARSSDACLKRLHVGDGDLVALSALSDSWIGRPPAAVAKSLGDALVHMVHADGVRVELRDPEGRGPWVASAGGRPRAAKPLPGERPDRETRPVTFPIGLEAKLGRVAIWCERPGFPNDLESVLLQAAANDVAIALQHSALLLRHERVERILGVRVTQQEAVAQLGLRVLTGMPVQQVFDQAVALVATTLHTELADVLELAPDGESLLVRAGVGWPPGAVEPCQDTALGAELRREIQGAPATLLRARGAASGLSVIIHDHHRRFGLLTAYSLAAREFTTDDLHFLQSVANLIAAALQRHRAAAEREASLAETWRAVAARDRAVSIVSHDLVNPLSTVQICVNALLDPDPPSVAGMRQMAEIIQRSATWMQQIVQDLLDHTTLDAGRLVLDRQPTAVPEVIGAAQVMFAPVARDQELKFQACTGRGLPPVHADRRRLLQILSNLLGNAMKFTPPGGHVVLSARATRGGRNDCGAGGVRFQVRDTGPGIAPEDQEHIFDWFWHAERAGRGGTGLGLAIAAGLVSAHSGRLRVESDGHRGSTFWFTVPCSGEAPAVGGM
jgi:signal transduction histidine kinase